MKYLLYFLAIFFLFILEAGVFSQFYFLPVIPPLVIVFSALLIPLDGRQLSIFSIIASGVLLDFLSSQPDGILLLSLVIACLVNYVLINWWLVRDYNIGILFISTAATILVYFVSVLILAKLFTVIGIGRDIEYGYLLTHGLVWSLLLGLVFTYPVYYYYLLLQKITQKNWVRKNKFA